MRLCNLWGATVVLFSFLGFALGQQELPDCAAQCLASSLKAQSVCTPSNTTCICMNEPLNAAVEVCVAQACTMKETLTALNVTATTCGKPVRDNTHVITIVAATTGSCAILLVLLRLYTAVTADTFGLDDGASAVAGVLLFAINGLTLTLGPAGIGRDIWTLSFHDIYRSLKLLFFCQLLVWPVSAVTKLAFLFFYLRIFPSKQVRIVAFVLMGLSFCWWLTFEFGNIFVCHPVSYFWQGWDGEHKGGCIDANSFIYAGSGINISIDISIILLPLPELFKLQLSQKKKVAIMAMFSVGGFTTIVAIIRLVQLRHYAKTTNPTMDDVGPDIWTMLELNVGVFCVCMPSARKFLARRFPTCFGSVKSSNPYDYSPNARVSSGRSGGKVPISTLGGIMKSVDTTVQRSGEDDEVELVQLEQKGENPAPSSTGSHERDRPLNDLESDAPTTYRQWR